MKKMFPLFLAAVLAALVLAACGTTLPTYGDPIPMKVGQPIEITNGEITAVVEYIGIDEFNQARWTCTVENETNCAEKHGYDIENMQFYYKMERIGKSDGANLLLTSGWEVKLYP